MLANMFGYYGYNHLGFFGWILMLLWWGLIIAGIVVFIRWVVMRLHGMYGHGSALSILEERFVRGEIDEEEFKKRKKVLLQSS